MRSKIDWTLHGTIHGPRISTQEKAKYRGGEVDGKSNRKPAALVHASKQLKRRA